MSLWSQTPAFLGNAQITLLLPGATGMMRAISIYEPNRRLTIGGLQETILIRSS
jgi:hypothetical protein